MGKRGFWIQVLGLMLLAGCGSGYTLGHGTVVVLGPAVDNAVICGQQGGSGSGPTILVAGSGFHSEHGVNIRVLFSALSGTPLEGGTSPTEEVNGVVLSNNLVEAEVPNLVGTAEVTITVILPGENLGTSDPVTLNVNGFQDGPYAFTDFYTMSDPDTSLTVDAAGGALANDFPFGCYTLRDGEVLVPIGPGSPLTIVAFDPVGTNGGGTLSMNPDGSFTYTRAPGFYGTTVFNYTNESNGLQSTSSVRITVFD